MPKPKVLFVCIENSCRSQMSEGLAKDLWRDEVEVWSAGSRPSGKVDPGAAAAMLELDIDISGHKSKGLEDLPKVKWDWIVTMGCGDACPHLPADHRADWDLPDPKGKGPDAYHETILRIRASLAALPFKR